MDYIVHGILQARILEWVAVPFSRGLSQPRDGTQVSCIAGRFFTSWGMLQLLLSRFSHVRFCATPWMAVHQAPPSLGFSMQEYWSGLPFPSPMHESEKWKWSHSVVSNSSRPHGLQPTRLLCTWDFPGKSTGVGCHCLLRCYSNHSQSLYGPGGTSGKEPACQCRRQKRPRFDPWVPKIPQEGGMATHSSILA